jgi:HD-GYP domain-containing protein (c-di-GMP phosphodiesterase class II)
MGMSDSRALLGKIRELRQRLAQVQGLVGEANQTAAALMGAEASADAPAEAQPKNGAGRQALLNASVSQMTSEAAAEEIRPTRLIAKVRVQLERGQELVAALKSLAEEPVLGQGDPASGTDDGALLQAYRDTAAMTESTLRLVQAFPDSPTSQIRLGEGLEKIVDGVAGRIGALEEAVALRKGEAMRRDALAGLLSRLAAGEEVDPVDFVALADYLLDEVKQSAPLRFLHAPAASPAAFVAAHSITTARVLARLIRHDADWQRCAHDAMVGALLKDVGMLTVPPEVLAHAGSLGDEQHKLMEGHCRTGSELVARHLPATATLCEAILSHHERLDGSGYPAGLRGGQIGPLPRLLAVADIYSAQCCPRPHRPALEPRTALTETMLLAERGLLDRNFAERLLQLSFYPVGSVVQLADGAVGLVVASHMAPRERHTPARPVVAILADKQGRVLPNPHHIDLAECDSRSIVSTLSEAQRHLLLGRRYPALA